MLANGVFSHAVFPEGERMNARNDKKVVEKHFGPWLQSAFWKGAAVKLAARKGALALR